MLYKKNELNTRYNIKLPGNIKNDNVSSYNMDISFYIIYFFKPINNTHTLDGASDNNPCLQGFFIF